MTEAVRSLFVHFLFLFATFFFLTVPTDLPASSHPQSAAFYYGAAPLPDELALFDIIVIDPGSVADLKRRSFPPESVYAYVSLGEVRKNDALASGLDAAWIKNTNETWQSHVMDQAAAGWRTFFIDRIVAPLRSEGVRNIFIDTMDSYHLFASTPQERSRQEAGMVETIRALKARYPDMRIILNRGFEVIEPLRDAVFAVAVESLFQGWNQAEQRYSEVGEKDRKWILEQTRRVRDRFGIPVIIIDYVAPADRELARRTARSITGLGFIPYVTNGSLDMLGLSSVEPMPRKILFLHTGMQNVDFPYYDMQRFGVMPLNYLGYANEYLDVSRPLPSATLKGRYAGIVVWLESPPPKETGLAQWLVRQKRDGIPIVFMNNLGVETDSRLLKEFGFEAGTTARQSTRISIHAMDRTIMGFEMLPYPVPTEFRPLMQAERNGILLDLADEHGSHMHAAAVTSWGGYVLFPFVLREIGENKVHRWIVNPLLFYQKAMKLPAMPVPDVTTHNGRRILMAHIDGDGAISAAEMNPKMLAGRMMLEQILKKYPIPVTVSVIEGETSPRGLYPGLSKSIEQTYREIFALPHVEPASHSFSHPFYWAKAAKNTDDSSYHLNLPGYTFNVRRETLDSLEYASRLAPGRKKARVFLWTGDCNPDVDAIGVLDESGYLSMNGGDTVISRENPSWTAIGPIGVQKGPYFQVFAPNQNENVYTDLWTRRFYGYERAVETFEMTDRPYRFKPINIYYHMYSASKIASLNALKKVYDYALKQDVVALYASDYIRKARDFPRVVVGRTEAGYLVSGAREVRELRIPRSAGYPSLAKSGDVIGFSDHEDSRYLHLAPASRHEIVLDQKPGRQVFVESVNADIPAWSRMQRGADFSLVSRQDMVKLRLGNVGKCSVTVNGVPKSPRKRGNDIAEYELKGKADVLQAVSVRCAD